MSVCFHRQPKFLFLFQPFYELQHVIRTYYSPIKYSFVIILDSLVSPKIILEVTIALSPSNITPGIHPVHTPLATKKESEDEHSSSSDQVLLILSPSIVIALSLKV